VARALLLQYQELRVAEQAVLEAILLLAFLAQQVEVVFQEVQVLLL
jgi:hypothetical protein